MDRFVVHTLTHDYHREFNFYVSSFGYNPKGRLPRLQRLLFWMLSKLGALHYPLQTVSSTTIKPTREWVESLLQVHDMGRQFYNRRFDTLLVGEDVYINIIKSDRYNGSLESPLPFGMEVRVGVDGRPSVMGFTLVLVPWMRGMVPISSEDMIPHQVMRHGDLQ